ncbi:hypothetical protein PRZ48_011212 [Zasmidium cellare]|uniref:F-box domain-containing protein n=1 Tax=Zasmidium cellare TaxID=395010 RepID=A0ABR0EB30_ZASCE|nr:hypothetical protein PRZ48_011212 [Zasmidium cellare]
MTATPDSTAGPKLASIPELVETIALQLPLRDILLAQQVNRFWSGVIQGSSKLQKALFFQPGVDETLTIRGMSDYLNFDCDCIKTPLPPRTFHLERPNHTVNPRWAMNETDRTDYVVTINPFLLNPGYDIAYDIEGALEDFAKAVDRDASLRRMLFTSPPVARLIMHNSGELVHLICRKPGAAGVTVADVLDVVATFPESCVVQLWMRRAYYRCDPGTTACGMLHHQKNYNTGRVRQETELDYYNEYDSDLEY